MWFLNTAVIFMGCSTPSKTIENTMNQIDLNTLTGWDGMFHLEELEDDTANTQPFVVRTELEFQSLVSKIPKWKIQMRQPAPPSEDPLLKLSDLDFSNTMMLVIISDEMYSEPKIIGLSKDNTGEAGDRQTQMLSVEYRIDRDPNAEMMSKPNGVGRYYALQVPLSEEVNFVLK